MSRKIPALFAAVALLAATLVALVGPASSAHAAAAPPKPTMVVIGDSMSALSSQTWSQGGYKYNDKSRHKMQAWWSILRRDTGYRALVHAEAGSGWNKRGRGCSLTSYAERVALPTVQKQLKSAKVVIILGGVNDSASCTKTTLEQAMTSTLTSVRAAAPKATLIVGSPWGTRKVATDRNKTIKTLRKVAAKHRATVVQVSLSDKMTMDHLHPNRAGTTYMAEKIRRAAHLPKVK